MSSQARFRFNSLLFILAAAASATGCATSGLPNAPEALGATMAQKESSALCVGEVQMLDAHVNPLAPVRLSATRDVILVRFTHPRAGGALLQLNATSLASVAPEAVVAAERVVLASNTSARVVFGDGRFVTTWKAGDAERGYRLMAQAWADGGSSLGQPVAISPPEADVLGAPQVVALEGDSGGRAVVTFTAMVGERAELLAVPLRVR